MLGYPEAEAWLLTPRKIYLLYQQHRSEEANNARTLINEIGTVLAQAMERGGKNGGKK